MFGFKVSEFGRHRVSHGFYLAFLVLFIAIRVSPFSTGSQVLDEALNDLSIGFVASMLVAWMIDVSDCKKRNEDIKRKEFYILCAYMRSLEDLALCVSEALVLRGYGVVPLSFEEWLSCYRANCGGNDELRAIVMRIQSEIAYLGKNYALLVESSIANTNDLEQHLDSQFHLAREALLACEEDDLQAMDQAMVRLVDGGRCWFGEDFLPEFYVWEEPKG